ncbi:MAG: hypothetical protein IK008_02735 [Bacteroidales bacterium]|nr:hypothetical protein [Bacteroidales bacterium]
MKTIRYIGLIVLAAVMLSSCGICKVKDISISSVGIAYIVPTSNRSMDGKLLLGINNPAMSFAIQDVIGTVRYKEKPIVYFRTDGLELQGKSNKIYELPCTVVLADGASLLDILIIASKRSLDGLKADVDIQAALKKNGILRAPYSFRDLDLSSFSK